jgi:prevent-host-death family protein
MEVGIREAKNNLSKLVETVRRGEKVYLTNRGQRVAEIVTTPLRSDWRKAYGLLRGKVNLYPGWDSPEEDKRIEDMFEVLQETKGE